MTPEEQEAVRRALAATPPAGPMPPEVVARLEATITGLAAERSAEAGVEAARTSATAGSPGAPDATVSELEARRRRRWPQVLVAAASVAVLAYGVGAVVQDAEPEAQTAATDSAGGEADEEGRTESGGVTDGGAAPQEAAPPGDREAPGMVADGRVVELRAASLRRDVVRHLELGRVAAQTDGLATLDAERYSRRDGTCLLPDLRTGDDVTAARLDGRRTTLVVHRAQDGTRVAEVYWCGDGRTVLAQTEVPARR